MPSTTTSCVPSGTIFIGAKGARLAAALRARAATEQKAGAIMSFASTTLFPAERVAAATAAGMRVVIIVGQQDLCLQAFVEREEHLKSGIGESRWWRNNRGALSIYVEGPYDFMLLLQAFNPQGSRLSRNELVLRFQRYLTP